MSTSTTGTAAGGQAAVHVARRMAAAATAWLDSLDRVQRVAATGDTPGVADESGAERLRWFYTPTDHGGLTLGAQRPAQQRLAHQLVATGLSAAGYVTVATLIGLENVLDRAEGWGVDFGRERGRDPGLYYLRVFGDPHGTAPWGWRFGGHHVSLNNLVVDDTVRSVTPCFLGANPASSPLLGPSPLRPLGSAEDLARELLRSLDPEFAARATLAHLAPSDIVSGNRARLGDGDGLLPRRALWRELPTADGNPAGTAGTGANAGAGFGHDAAEDRSVTLSDAPKGLPASALDAGQRHLLRALLGTYLGRVPDSLSPLRDYDDEAALDAIHIAWAGPTAPGRPHYYRLQGPRLLIEYDNTQNQANHAHSVWRDPVSDFGHDVLAAHREAHHR